MRRKLEIPLVENNLRYLFSCQSLQEGGQTSSDSEVSDICQFLEKLRLGIERLRFDLLLCRSKLLCELLIAQFGQVDCGEHALSHLKKIRSKIGGASWSPSTTENGGHHVPHA